MRVRTKFAIVLVVIAVVLSGVVAGSLEVFKQQAVQDTNDEVNATVDLTAEQIDSRIRERRDFIGYVASQSGTREFDQSRAILLDITRNSRFYAAQLIHRNGTVIDFRGDVTEAGRERAIGNETNETYALAALDGRTFVSDPRRTPDGRALVVISAPVLYPNGSVKGALAAAIFVNQQTFLQGTRPLETESRTVQVVDAEGEELEAAEETFDNPISAKATVPTTGWEVRIQRDRSDLTRRLRNFALVQAVSLFFVLGTVVGFGFWEYRTNLRQTERLLDGFGALLRGNYDYSLSLSSGEEWTQISDGFNDLASGLAEREAALREREQRLDVLNRVLRHNVRNEMSVVLNYADLIGDLAGDEQIAGFADDILEAGEDLTALSDKAKQVQAAFDDADRLVAFDAADLVADAVAPVADAHEDAEIRSEVDADVAVAGIPALGDAVENVVENACEHNDSDDPVVEITAERDGDRVRLAVADNGPGIPEHEYAVLESGEETALEHGSGLGLWLVYWVVDRSGGELSFDDREPRGAVVTLDLAHPDAVELGPRERALDRETAEQEEAADEEEAAEEAEVADEEEAAEQAESEGEADAAETESEVEWG